MKNSFVMYTDYKQHIDLLTLEEKGRLLDAIFNYAEGNEVELDGMVMMAFSFIKSQMDRDKEKYDRICEMRRESGAKGGLAKASKSKQKLANGSKRKQSLANVADTDTDTDTVTDTVTDTENDTDTDIKKSGDKPHRFTPPSREEVQAYCIERNNNVDAQAFIDFYISKGWMVGKNPMKDWKAAVRTWENRHQGKTNNVTSGFFKVDDDFFRRKMEGL